MGAIVLDELAALEAGIEHYPLSKSKRTLSRAGSFYARKYQ